MAVLATALSVVVGGGGLARADEHEPITTPTNLAPVIIPTEDKELDEGSSLDFTIQAIDPEDDRLTYDSANAPPGSTLDPSTGAFSWIPGCDAADSSPYTVTFNVADDTNPPASDEVIITVEDANCPPELAPVGPQNVSEGSTLSFTLFATDVEGDTLTYSAPAGLPSAASLDTSTGAFSWTPGHTEAGTYEDIELQVSDGEDEDSEIISITVTDENGPPVFGSIGDQTVNENDPLAFTVTATDPDAETVTLSATGLPTGATFDTSTGAFAWTPTFSQVGTYPVRFEASAGAHSSDEEITITVTNVNRFPELGAIGNRSTNEGVELGFTISASDADLDTLVLSASNLPSGAQFDPATGAFTWTPTFSQAGSHTKVRFEATDGTDTDVEEITIAVENVNRVPVLGSVGDRSASEDSELTFTLAGTDADAETLTYSGSNLPSGSSVDPGTGVFSWTPTFDQAGTYSNVGLVVGDGTDTDTETITITVSNVNRAPILAAIGNRNANEGEELSFTLSGFDPDADGVTYSGSNLPQGATVNATTGVFSWTPDHEDAGTYPNVSLRTSDGNGGQDTEVVTITVADVNARPRLRPIGDQVVAEGDTLSFEVSATDVDGDDLTYSATDLPFRAKFDPRTRRFTWSPSFDYAGTYTGIRFEVTDGERTDPQTIRIDVLDVVPGQKTVTLTGNKKRIRLGERVKITAVVAPCEGHGGDELHFLRGHTVVAAVLIDSNCTATISVRPGRTGPYSAASSQQDTDHAAGLSKPLVIKVRKG